jgi:hypothetical protein
MDMVERGGQTAMGVTPRRSGRRVWFRGRIPEVRTRGYSRTRRADGDGSDTSPVGTSSVVPRPHSRSENAWIRSNAAGRRRWERHLAGRDVVYTDEENEKRRKAHGSADREQLTARRLEWSSSVARGRRHKRMKERMGQTIACIWARHRPRFY